MAQKKVQPEEGEIRPPINLNHQRKKRRLKKIFSAKVMITVLLIVLGITGIVFSPLFSVRTILVTEMKKYTQSEICEKIGLSEGMNIMAFGKKAAIELLEKDPYISSVSIKRQFPSTIRIIIEERRVRGYVPFMGSYLYIDEYGRVLERKNFMEDNLPVVNGLEFSQVQIGEILKVDNEESFDVIVRLSQMMVKYEITDVFRIDVSDPKDIHAYVKQVDVLLGGVEDLDEKISVMKECIKQLSDKDRGTLDLRDMDKPIIFKYLT